MSTAAGDVNAPAPFDAVRAAVPMLARVNLVLVAGLLVALCCVLWPHWRDNPDLSHGYFMPLVFLFLLHEARSGSPRYLEPSLRVRLAGATLLTLGLAALCTSGVYAAAVDWSSTLVAFLLAFAAVCLLGGSLLAYASTTRLIPFNWTACAAVGLWLLCAPIPPGTYTRLTIGLQLMVTENVLGALHLLGIAATRHGNIIELATTSVGVEDACSGVRSLISCIFAGVFFSATLVRGPWRRLLLIGLAAPLAIAMNFVRSLALTLLANRGVDITGEWHDWTGFAVLGVTAAILAGLALALEKKTDARAVPPTRDVFARKPAYSQRHVTLALVLTTGLTLLFVANTRPSVRPNAQVPDLARILPATAEGWHVDTSKDIYQFTETLRTTHLAQRTYLRRGAMGVDQITIYLAYWPAGQAPVSLVASHTPDACWPGAGWSAQPVSETFDEFSIEGRRLAGTETRSFRNGAIPQHVWFWHLYDGRPIEFVDPYSAGALLELALRYGFRRGGDQLFVRVSSNRPWSTVAAEPLVREVFTRLRPLGL